MGRHNPSPKPFYRQRRRPDQANDAGPRDFGSGQIFPTLQLPRYPTSGSFSQSSGRHRRMWKDSTSVLLSTPPLAAPPSDSTWVSLHFLPLMQAEKTEGRTRKQM